MPICIFEDEQYLNFEPLIYSRPVFDLVCGMTTLKEKIIRAFPKEKFVLKCRNYLEPFVKTENPKLKVNQLDKDNYLFVNGRIIAPANLKNLLKIKANEEKVFVSNGIVVAANLSQKRVELLELDETEVIDTKLFSSLPTEEIDVECANYLWDLVYLNGKEIQNDFKIYTKGKSSVKKKYTGVNFVNKKNIFIGKNVDIKPGVVLDASTGPIFIEKNVTIFPNAVIQGPFYIGESSKIKSCATIYPNVSIGKVCKVGGEVEDTIIHPYSNKQHSGFLGHSYLGSWINLGADTNNSDLQNNYGSIKVQVNGRHIDSGKQFVGLMMGDHSKTAINTMFNTGTVVGFSSNVYGAGFPPKYIVSFGWGGTESMKEYKLLKAIETAKAVFARRDKNFEKDDVELFETIFNLTKEDRRKRGY
ncbi:MAG: GlmU family protein [Ignavibacteriaceae bacterium]|jgi:UDP-N-acetylglucosamine diphosphorylase / glucose-1-phosphate thymidylyltransferase / UDP-N-acetylgalactosamine diphosphorylase / glucosamine-1-phosphate N-acetyltransferase / galactosamine-1-phosphate N-acetyltransferase|nr:GlmU family protein [Ignavibacteriaceae bacterium]